MNVKKLLSSILAMTVINSAVPVTYARDTGQNTQSFYEDFNDGMAFWKNTGSQMRIIDGCLTTDAYKTVAVTELQGVTAKKYRDFTMTIEFTIKELGDWFGIYIRGGTDSQIHFVVNQNGFYTLPAAKTQPPDCRYKFEEGIKYTMRITAEDTTVTAEVKKASENSYITKWTGEFDGSGAGTISFASYRCIAAIDSVEISEKAFEPIYYSKKIVKIPVGQTVLTHFENKNGVKPDSVSYTCTGENFSVDSDGAVTAGTEEGDDCGCITATVTVGDKTYTASYDVIRSYPVTALNGGGKYCEMTVGDTKNILVGISPSNASNNELEWKTSNPEAIELVGDTVLSRGVRALNPAKNVRITARSKENNSIVYDEYITVKGKSSEIKAQKFEVGNVKRKIPTHMFGLTVNTEMAMLKNGQDKTVINEYVDSQIPNLREMKVQQFRKFFDGYDYVNGKYYNGDDVGYSVSDMYRAANELGIPINLTLDYYYDSTDKILGLIEEIKKAAPDTEICLGIFEEVYDGRMEDYEPLKIAKATDYTDFLKKLYPAVKAKYPDVKIGAPLIDYVSDRLYSKSNSELLGKWNSTILANKDYFDAVVIHEYSGSTTNSTTDKTTKSVMEDFAIDSASIKYGLNLHNKWFADKEIWLNEFGDLPMNLLWKDASQSRAARNQYMKSLGNAMSYMQRFFDWTAIDNVTMAAYFLYNDNQGFGCVQKATDAKSECDVQKYPSYYTLSVVGDVFEKNTHIYPLVTDMEDTDLFYKHSVNPGDDMKVDVSRLNAWAFGDGENINEAVFVNNSEYDIKVYLPGYMLKKRMVYGDGSNPVPKLAVNDGDLFTDNVDDIPLPEYYDESMPHESFILMKPYSILRADLIPDVNGEQVIPDPKNEIKPHLTEIVDDSFENGFEQWDNENNWEITADGKLKLDGAHWNTVLEPKSKIASESLTVEYDVYGYSKRMYIQFYNADNPEEILYVRVMDEKDGMSNAEVMDLKGKYHKFGVSANTRGKWQTIKFELNDGLLYSYIKDSNEPEFIEALHKKGRPYSYEYLDENGNNVSMLRKGVKYGIRIYNYIHEESGDEILIDNLKIAAADTAVNITAADDSFTLKNLDIYVKTDSGFELSDRPVSGTVNKFIPNFEGTLNENDKVIAAFYSDGELIDAVVSEYKNGAVECVASADGDRKTTSVKFMIWKNEDLTPKMRAVEYILN